MVEELKNINYKVIGVITPKIEIPNLDRINELDEKSLKLCMLDSKDLELTSKNKSKLQLASNLNKDIIVLYDFSKGLNFKEINYFNRLLKKLTTQENKKIIIVSRDIEFLSKICNYFVIFNKHIIYESNNIFDDNLYKYIDMPKIVKIIKVSNEKGIKLKNTTDINELIKDIYRRKNESKNSI